MLLMLCLLTATAQTRRGNCMPGLTAAAAAADGSAAAAARQKRIWLQPNSRWDASKTYRQLVVLVSFADLDFGMDDPQAYYNRLFNEQGYNEGIGPGCVADYFRAQSGGQLNIQFDVVGPYKASTKAQPYANPTEKTRNFGIAPLREAAKMAMQQMPEGTDFSAYDWDDKGRITQLVMVYAGISGNGGEETYGYIWPSTDNMGGVSAPDGRSVNYSSASSELLPPGKRAGIGTICHEFMHCLGLPDIYPTTSDWAYSVVDEWDLMDGGNFSNWGWCPPNLSAHEKMLLGWFTPTKLDKPTYVSGMACSSDGGPAYQVMHTDNEFLMLENRQRKGWDSALPGQGLLVSRVNYNKDSWAANNVNNSATSPRYILLYADGRNYDDWDELLYDNGLDDYVDMEARLYRRFLSTAAYPYEAEDRTNDRLTDDSNPAASMINANAAGSYFLSKPITDISISADGLASFRFMGGTDTGISTTTAADRQARHTGATYNMLGQRVQQPRRGIYIRNGRKVMITN